MKINIYYILFIISMVQSQTIPSDVFGKYNGIQDKYVYYANNVPNEIPKSNWEMNISSSGVEFMQKSDYGTFIYSGIYTVSKTNDDININANVKEEKSGGAYNLELTLLYKDSSPYWNMKAATGTPDIILIKDNNTSNINSEESLSKGGVFDFCPSCGFPNKNKFTFCPRCGSDLKLIDSSDNVNNNETSNSISDLEASMVDTPIEAQQAEDIPIGIGKLVQPQKIPGQYTVQVASKPTIHDARGIQDNLIDNGFNSYLQEVKFSDNNDIWYRIRVGKYRKHDRATLIRNKVATIYGDEVWVDNVRMDID